MKTFPNKLASKFALAAFLALGTLAVTSCNKDNQAGQEVPEGNSQLIVRIAGISDGENINSKGTKGSTSNNSGTQSVELVQSSGFDAIVALDNKVPSIETPTIAQAGLKASNGSKAVSAPLAATTTYRLYLYKNNGGTYTFAKSMQFTPGTEAPIQIPNGSYKWVALSYNNTDAIPDADVTNNLVLPENKDVLYATSGATDIVINANTAPLSITFNRLYSRIAIEVNTLGMFAPINSATIAVTGQSARAATLDLTTGALTLAPSAGVPALTEANFTDIDGNASRKVAYYYTADLTAQNLSVTVGNLSIKLDNATDRVFTTPQTFTQLITPERGKNHRFLVGIAESAITYGGVKWARSNLYYRTGGTLTTTPYRFYHTNPFSPAVSESFFSFKGHLPGVLANAVEANQKDPCALVYPAGLWKTPINTEIGTLTSQQGVISGLLGALLGNPATPNSTFGPNYIEYSNSAGSATGPYATTPAANILRFNYNGLNNTVNLLSGTINVTLGQVGSTAAFWGRDNVLDGGLLALLGTSVGAWSYIGRTQDPVIGNPRSVASKGAGALNIDLLNLGLVGSGFQNVRCVRNANFTAISAAQGYNPMPTL